MIDSFPDDELLPISALQHLVFCERQCALIHVERLWAENQLTVEGQILHEKAHDGSHQRLGALKIARGLWLVSRKLGLVGQADVVEFHSDGSVLPIEYKRGKPKSDGSDEIQLCAQAMCLEEQLNVSISRACLFYGQRKRRTDLKLDSALRDLTLAKIHRLREMIDRRETPSATRMRKCDKCSLIELCVPDGQRLSNGVSAWNQRQFSASLDAKGPATDEFEFME